jgi:hypothetical protein
MAAREDIALIGGAGIAVIAVFVGTADWYQHGGAAPAACIASAATASNGRVDTSRFGVARIVGAIVVVIAIDSVAENTLPIDALA